MKILWFDCETTGLDPVKNDIITLSAIVEIEGKIENTLNLTIQPHSWDNIEDSALKINGITRDELKTFDSPKIAHKKLVTFLEKYVNRFDKFDKFQPAGYNITFDILFLSEFFKKCGDKYFGSWVDYHKFDVATLVQFLHLKGVLNFENYKLVTVAKEMNIEFKAHEAQADIETTRSICYKLLDMIEIKKCY